MLQDEGLLVKGDPSWESGAKDPVTNKNFQCWDPADACASCEPDLIDYPPKYLGGYCSPHNRSTVINAYGAHTLDALAAIATALGETQDAVGFTKNAAKIRAALLETTIDAEASLFWDGVGSNHSSLAAQYFALGFGVLDGAAPEVQEKMGGAILALVINETIARTEEPACSCMGGHWLLEALYTLGRATTPGLSQGADGGTAGTAAMTALRFLTHNATWLGMISQGATATMEVWVLTTSCKRLFSRGFQTDGAVLL